MQWASGYSMMHVICLPPSPYRRQGMYTIYYSTIVDYHLGGWETQGVGHCPKDKPYQGERAMCLVRKTMRFIRFRLESPDPESGTEKHSLNLEWIYHSLNIEPNSRLFKLKENFGTRELLNTLKRHAKKRQVLSRPKDTPPHHLSTDHRETGKECQVKRRVSACTHSDTKSAHSFIDIRQTHDVLGSRRFSRGYRSRVLRLNKRSSLPPTLGRPCSVLCLWESDRGVFVEWLEQIDVWDVVRFKDGP